MTSIISLVNIRIFPHDINVWQAGWCMDFLFRVLRFWWLDRKLLFLLHFSWWWSFSTFLLGDMGRLVFTQVPSHLIDNCNLPFKVTLDEASELRLVKNFLIIKHIDLNSRLKSHIDMHNILFMRTWWNFIKMSLKKSWSISLTSDDFWSYITDDLS